MYCMQDKTEVGENMRQEFETRLFHTIDKEKIYVNEKMEKHTTFRIGGPADYFVMPSDVTDVKAVIELCEQEKVPYYVVGNGSNLLVGDKGFRGVIIQIAGNMNQLQADGEVITAQAGCSLAQIAGKALDEELAGFEFAAGIPGTLGGAVRMNAGAYGGEIKDVLESAVVLTREGKVMELSVSEMEFDYRTSIIERTGWTILGGKIRLHKGKREEIKAVMDDLREKRVSKQPLEYPSAGSTFKRPKGYFAGKLIQDAGLRGFRVGGACVSEKHSGFVINIDHATADDVVSLMEQVDEKVRAQFGVGLEPEVRRIGEF